ncbi:hypothetical protein PI87_23805 [Ralstonia sp. A12]|uniref:hypothetical protein n=1 Tax=Ralstonia sp. A12 TaxID=1217052 RepID=UPI000575BABB|nr:hypothetical protein [Ralstonia sp. A12]KHK50201.1 hypothetical protein PI87_23805 [Ralstonia sp. A12]
MAAGLAIYDTGSISPIEACRIGEAFFDAIGERVANAAYYRYVTVNGEQDVELKEVPLPELRAGLSSGEMKAFRLYAEKPGAQPWLASFGYMTDEFGGFHHMDAQCTADLDDVYTKLVQYLNDEVPQIACSYGMLYQAKKVADAFYYAEGENLARLFDFEDPTVFKRDAPGRFKGPARYRKDILRMVYPCNVLNDSHLDIQIQGTSLKAWIANAPDRGALTSAGAGLWLWQVEGSNIDSVNRSCGEAGILLAWKPPAPQKARRALP